VREDTIYAIANGANAQWYKSASGDNWTFIESTIFTYAECVLGTTIFSARGDGLWVSAVPTSVPQPSPVPSRFTLGQNYPNPFNPATTISFGLPVRSHVTLTVYDVMGREVTALVDEELAPGTYTRQWTAARMAGGVYFYRLQTPVFTETKRLVLLR
jgi:hypothetical protein